MAQRKPLLFFPDAITKNDHASSADSSGQYVGRGIDVLLITGDVYVDHPSYGIAIIARFLQAQGLQVAIVSQPFVEESFLTAFGKPRLFVGITAGNIDSMVANYTASMKKRRIDDYLFENAENKRPDRATITYTNLVKRIWKEVPIVLGGIEASLRRFGHYDWWQDKVRHSVLLDSKADFIFYGMAEKTLGNSLEFFGTPDWKAQISKLPGVAYTVSNRDLIPKQAIELPCFEEIQQSKQAYSEAYRIFYEESDAVRGKILFQKDGTRYVVQNPPSLPLSTAELDAIYELPYTRQLPEAYKKEGTVKGLETVRFTITSHRGCYGACAFCAISIHQGRMVACRSEDSIIREVEAVSATPAFKGYISDVGGPTANMYGFECNLKYTQGACKHRQCIFPTVCPSLKPDHTRYMKLLDRVLQVEAVKGVFIASGIRPDLVLADQKNCGLFMKKLVKFHVSGQLKIAPEHSEETVTRTMRKYPIEVFDEFCRLFYQETKAQDRKLFIIPYLLLAHPGEGKIENQKLKEYLIKKLGFIPQQLQIFTPTPSTIATTIFYTGFDPWTKEPVFTEKELKNRNDMKSAILNSREGEREWQP